MSVEMECERLILDFAHYSDTQNYEAMAALFVSDGVLVRPSAEALTGPVEILRSDAERSGSRITRHLCSNIRITAESDDNASGFTYALVFSANAGAAHEGNFGVAAEPRQLVGEFDDKFVKTPDGWRFKSRIYRFVMHT